MIKELLRKPLAQEVVALLEKIDSIDSTSDSSYYRARCLIAEGTFSHYERMLLRNALRRIPRRETLHEAMNVVINASMKMDEPSPPPYWGSSLGAMVDRNTSTAVRKGIWDHAREYLERKAELKKFAIEQEYHRATHIRAMRDLEQAKLQQEVREKEMQAEAIKHEMAKKYSPRIAKEAEQRAYYTIDELNRKFAK